jgi:hypothetical protein
VNDRGGFLALPHEMRAEARRELEPVQRWLAVELAGEANWETGRTARVDGVAVALDAGEVLLSTRGFADRHGVSRDVVRRFLDRIEALGWIERCPAAPSPAPHPAPRAAPRAAPPPTLVRFRKWREIMWPPREAAPPPAPSPAPCATPHPAPILHMEPGEPLNTNTEKPSRAPAARRRKASKDEPSDPRHRPLQERLEGVFLEVRGTSYGFNGRDAKAITELLRLSGGDVAEVERRWRAGLGDSGFRRCDTIHELADRKWNAYAGVAPGKAHGMLPMGTKYEGPAPWDRPRPGAPLPAIEPEGFPDETGGF